MTSEAAPLRPAASPLEGAIVRPTASLPEGRVRFVPLGPEHFFALDVQDSQRTQYGLDPLEMDWREAQAVADNPNCWAALRMREDGEAEVIACLGINETFPGAQGVAFAFLGKGLGRDHLAITRFARDHIIGASRLPRVEAIVRCADVERFAERNEAWLEKTPPLRRPVYDLMAAYVSATPQVRWALAVGLEPVAVLRKFGAAGETHMLMERVL